MITKLEKIVVVGGGSAGWMSAAALIKTFPEKEIVVIESPDVPTIGVGESTLGQFKEFCFYLNIDEKDFMTYCDASYKMSIRFVDFYQIGDGGFHYPFGTPFRNDTVEGMNDWLIKKCVLPETPITDFVHCYFPAAALFEQNKFSLNETGEFDNYNPKFDVAYHFDAIKFASWLRENYCKPKGVKHIAATVVDVKVNDDGVEKLILNTGEEVTADLFFDCTGFKSLLIGQTLKQEFYSYSHMLPNNRAWACQVPYKNKEIELQAYTNCTAIGNGWVWNTPIWSRLGTGYVYSDKYISPENAKEEFKQYLMSDRMVIPRTREEVDSYSFKDVPMRVGAYKKSFVKNVVAIGLSSAFIEPLESNGLYSVHIFLLKLMKILMRPAINQFDKDAYNYTTFTNWKSFADFVSQHYALSIRTDTEYWRNNFKRELISNYLDESESLKSSYSYLIKSKMVNSRIHDPKNGINWISVGMNWFYIDSVDISHMVATNPNSLKQYNDSLNLLEERKEKWWKAAESAPSLYEYQKKHIYNEE
jgi:tryptophan halogenase